MTNNEEVILTITFGYMEIKSGFYGLTKKNKNVRNKGFIFNEIVSLKKTTDSSLSSISICYFLKFRIPIMHRHFFRIIS